MEVDCGCLSKEMLSSADTIGPLPGRGSAFCEPTNAWADSCEDPEQENLERQRRRMNAASRTRHRSYAIA